MTELVIYKGGSSDGLGHLFPEHRAESFSKSMNRNLDRGLGQFQIRCHILVAFGGLAYQEGAQSTSAYAEQKNLKCEV